MADPLFPHGQLPPGAPSLDDDRAWAPAGGPVGAVPDATPFTPRAINAEALTPEQRHAMRQAISSGDRGAYERFLNSLTAGQQNASPAGPGSPAGEAPAEGGEVVPGGEPDASPERRAMAEKLTALGSDIQMVDALEVPIDQFHDRLLAMPEADRHAAILEGEQQVIDRLFRGSEGAFKNALAEIKQAAMGVGGADLIKAIDDSAVLADPGLFERMMLLARTVNSNSKGAGQ